MKTLTHGQQVRSSRFAYQQEITVGTVEGYAKKYKEDPEPAVVRAINNGHALAWTNQLPAVLTSDYPGKSAEMVAKRERIAAATKLIDGEDVMIEGRKYTVKIIGSQYSDPFHFIQKECVR